MYDTDPVREMGIYVLVELSHGAESKKIGLKVDNGLNEGYYQMLKSFDEGILSSSDIVPRLKDWIEGHKNTIRKLLQKPLPHNMKKPEGKELLDTLEIISTLSDSEISEALELTKPTLTQILQEFEQARA